MGRAPCCEKAGLKKGPWSPEEDRILISYVQKHGHANWRALPKQAGLLRCGKSCRLRWINYLRPDIKRGNFTKEEEESIIKLHEMLGNRWSAIAARLPGRTDNEIKNVWHTHLKKRLNKQNQDNINPEAKQSPNTLTKCDSNNSIVTTATTTIITQSESENSTNDFHSHPTSSNSSSVSSPQPSSSSEASSSIEPFNSLTNGAGVDESDHHVGVKTEQTDNCNNSDEKDNLLEIDDSFWSETLSSDDLNTVTSLTSGETNQMDIILENLPEIDQSFWSDEFSSTSTADNINIPLDFGGVKVADQLQQIGSPFISIDDYMVEPTILNNDGYIHPQVGNGDDDNGMDFWYNVFVNSSGESIQPLF